MQPKHQKFLFYWLWVWPLFGGLVLVWNAISPATFRNCGQVLFVPGLIGSVAAGWTTLRTMDKRFSPQLGAAAIVLVLGVAQYWNYKQ